MPLQQKVSNSGLGKAFGAHARPLGSHASPCRRPFTGTLKKDYFFLAAVGAAFSGAAAPAWIGLLGVVRGTTGFSKACIDAIKAQDGFGSGSEPEAMVGVTATS
jgi:hypothetical protein